jgi:hypothetical protein
VASKREEHFLEPDPVELPADAEINGEVEYLPNTEDGQSPMVQEAWRIVEQAAHEDPLLRRLLDSVHILRRIGGVIQIGALRKELAPSIYRTEEYVWQWRDYNLKRPEESQSEEPEPAEVE